MGRTAADSAETKRLLGRVAAGEPQAWDRLVARHRAYLKQVVALRLDPALRARLDASDVVQEAEIEATRRIDSYLRQPVLPFRLWMRQICHDRVLMARRHHAGAARRAVGRDFPLPDHSSLLLAERLLAPEPTPSQAAVRGELRARVRHAVAALGDDQREIILMRNFEALSNQEVAQVLGIDPATASRRYGRALLRLRELLADHDTTEL